MFTVKKKKVDKKVNFVGVHGKKVLVYWKCECDY